MSLLNDSRLGVTLIDHMGSDKTIIMTARHCYQSTGDANSDVNLIKHLLKENHKSPFEHVVFQFLVTCPIAIARQWMRHRIGSYQEISGRYTDKADIWQPILDERCISLDKQTESMLQQEINQFVTKSIEFYKKLRTTGVPREIARFILPQSNITSFYWTVNASALMNFLTLRTSKHAQKEMQVFANDILKHFETVLPITSDIFKESLNKQR